MASQIIDKMIQRIQSVYLSLIVLISLLLFKGSLLVFTENTGFVINVTFNGIFRDTNGQGIVMIERLLPLSILIILIPVVSLITIFLIQKKDGPANAGKSLDRITVCIYSWVNFLYIPDLIEIQQ